MNISLKAATAASIAAVFLLAMPVMADSGGGGGSTGSSDSIDMTYVALGLALIVGGFLVYDAISDSGDDSADQDTTETGIVDTGIDWDNALSSVTGQYAIAVNLFPGPNGRERAMELIGALRELSNENVNIYRDPVDLGHGSGVERAALAREFFGSNYLIFQVPGEDSTLAYGIANPDTVLWTSSDQRGNNMVVVATQILQSGIF